MENKAAFLLSPKNPLEVRQAPLTQPAANEVLIRNHAIAINPIDYKQQDMGVLVTGYPYIMGRDIAGTIVEVGADVSDLNKGDRIVAVTTSIATGNQAHAGFQRYTVLPARVVSRIPDNLAFTDAVVLPTGLATAATGLFESEFLGISPPSASAAPPAENSENVILVWGGSGSVGSNTIQLCAAAGLVVLATASSKNFEYVKALGASQAFDYNDPDVVAKLVEAAQGRKVLGAYDTVASKDTTLACARFLQKLGGGTVFCTLPSFVPLELPEGVKRVDGHGPHQGADGGPPVWMRVWKDFLREGLKNGKLRAKPEALVLEGGLERLQAAVELCRKGTSAQKVVVELEH